VSTSKNELAREDCAAISRRDADWLIEHSHSDIEMHMTGVAGEPVLYSGWDGIREWLHDTAEIWESMEMLPERSRIMATACSRSSA
jgi:hypothetical protein